MVIGSAAMDCLHSFFLVLRFCFQPQYTSVSEFSNSALKFDQSHFKIIWYAFQISIELELLILFFAVISKFKCKLCFCIVR